MSLEIAPFPQEIVEGARGQVRRPQRGGIPRHHAGDPRHADRHFRGRQRGRQRRGRADDQGHHARRNRKLGSLSLYLGNGIFFLGPKR